MMTVNNKRVLLVAVVAMLVCAATDAAPSSSIAQDVQQAINGFEKAFASKDISSAAAFFTADAAFMSAGNAPFVGTSSIETALGGLQAEGTVAFQLTVTQAVAFADSYAYAQAGYTKFFANSQRADTGYSTMVLTNSQSASGAWQVIAINSVSNETSSASPMLSTNIDTATKGFPTKTASDGTLIPALQQWADGFGAAWRISGNDVAAMFTSDGTLLATHLTPAHGSSQIASTVFTLQSYKDWHIASAVIVDAGVSSSDSITYARGGVNFYGDSGELLWGGNFLGLFQMGSDGSWKAIDVTASPAQFWS